jgi:medium-chain acyl-[acyl-carrier-protein] hydrolase
MKTFLEQDFMVHSYETNLNGNLKLNCLVQWFSEIAWQHVKILKIGFDDLLSNNRFWVLLNYDIKINKLPKWQQIVKLKTSPSGIIDFYFTRDFLLTDNNGDILASASSTWLILNKQTRRIVIPKGEEFAALNIIPPSDSNRKFDKLKAQTDFTEKHNFIARFMETDINLHINNAVYVMWLEEIIRQRHSIQRLKIQYIKEVEKDTNVEILSKRVDDIIYFEGKNVETNLSVFRAEVMSR